MTRVHTPLFWGQFCRAGAFVFLCVAFRPNRTSWLIVGINLPATFPWFLYERIFPPRTTRWRKTRGLKRYYRTKKKSTPFPRFRGNETRLKHPPLP